MHRSTAMTVRSDIVYELCGTQTVSRCRRKASAGAATEACAVLHHARVALDAAYFMNRAAGCTEYQLLSVYWQGRQTAMATTMAVAEVMAGTAQIWIPAMRPPI